MDAIQRVLFLDQYGDMGGGQQVLLQIIRYFSSRGCATHLLSPPGKLAKAAEAYGTVSTPLALPRLQNGKKGIVDAVRLFFFICNFVFAYGKQLRTYDLIYVNGARLLPAVLACAVLFGNTIPRIILHMHIKHTAFENRLFEAALHLKKTSALFCPSTFILRYLQQSFAPSVTKKIYLLENALSVQYGRLQFENRFCGNGLENIAILGRISPEKGHMSFLTLARIFPAINFHVFGDAAFADDSYYRKLRAQAANNVIFHGWVDDVPSAVRRHAIQCIVIPSQWEEPFGLAAIEAMACSCLVAVRDSGALAEIAARCTADVFADDAALQDLIGHYAKLPHEELAARAFVQYTRTHAEFAPTYFEKQLASLLARLQMNATGRDQRPAA